MWPRISTESELGFVAAMCMTNKFNRRFSESRGVYLAYGHGYRVRNDLHPPYSNRECFEMVVEGYAACQGEQA